MRLFECFFLEDDMLLSYEAHGMILKTIRTIFNLKQKELGKLINISPSYISSMESGKKNITFQTKLKIAKAALRHNGMIDEADNISVLGIVIQVIMDKIMKNEVSNLILKDLQSILNDPTSYEMELTEETMDKLYKDVMIEERIIKEPQSINRYTKIKPVNPVFHYDADSQNKRKILVNNLNIALDQNGKYHDELITVLQKSLADISSYFNDIDIIRKYDLETTIDRISRSIKKLLRESYNNIHRDVPVLGYVGAGVAYDYVSLNDIINIPKAEKVDFALNIRGDSMSPAYQDGDVVFVKRQPNLENGEYGIFEIEGQYLFKRYFKENGNIKLSSLNKSYDDIIFSKEDKPESFEIIGKVIIGSR